jgi:predicted nucleic acid-binding Zn ribbon protein
MALIKCHECGEAVSDHARTCPKCGAPVIATIKRRQKAALRDLMVRLAFAAIVGLAVWMILSHFQKKVLAPLKTQQQNQTAPR